MSPSGRWGPASKRWFAASVLFLLTLRSAPAEAAVADYLGRTIAEVRIRSQGAAIQDAALLELIETRPGTPLTMPAVRETIVHLFSLGRFEDIGVDADLRGDGVVLVYDLVPALRVAGVEFRGVLGLSEGELRRTIVERYGASPPPARADEAARALLDLYLERGYRRADVRPRVEATGRPDRATLVFDVRAGDPSRLGRIDVDGTPPAGFGDLLSGLGIRSGDVYDRVALDARLAGYADRLRAQGYYEARVSQIPQFREAEQLVDLVVTLDPGPRVTVAFEGDPLDNRDVLVPIAEERSVDEDLLENAQIRIEAYLRDRGYRNARAPYRREPGNGTLRIVFTVERGPQHILDRITIRGNEFASTAELRSLIGAKPGRPFVESVLGADIARLESLYRRRGFFGAKITPQIQQTQSGADVAVVDVVLMVAEGVRTTVRSVSFQGNSVIPDEVLRQTIASGPGQPYYGPQVDVDADTITLEYLNRGYETATVQPEANFSEDGAAVDLRFAIQEGPQVLVDHILIVGNVRTRTQTIADEVQLRSGQPLSLQEWNETRSRLAALGLFRDVRLSEVRLPGSETHRDVVITVEEALVMTIGYGGGLEGGKRPRRTAGTQGVVEVFEFAPRGFFEIGRRNLWGKDRSITLFTRVSFRPRGDSISETSDEVIDTGGYGFNEYRVVAAYTERRIFGTTANGVITGLFEQAVRSSFNFNRRGASAQVTRPLRPGLAVIARYSIDRTRLFDEKLKPEEKLLVDRLFPAVRLSTLSASLVRDTRNDPIEPVTGALISLDGDLAARRIGSEVGLFKTFLQGSTYRRLPGSRGIVAAFRGELGLATGFPREVVTIDEQGRSVTQVVDDLPASERFYAGGDNTVRGFALDRLGTPDTIDADGFPKGGHGLLVMNAELRVPVRGGLGVVGFLDAGNVYSQVSDFKLGDVRASAGFGVRYRSPVGPIRVDLGFKLDRRVLSTGARERATALHVSLGQTF